MTYKFKTNIEFGVATSATQIEGGKLPHNWDRWFELGHIKDDSDPARANQHYKLWKQDIDLMKSMGISVYRLGIEWARIEPKEGKINKKAIEHYREMLSYINETGIKPLLTIHHFTNPLWFEDKGGFSKSSNIKLFLRFTKLVIKSFGDLVSEYITINEPNVYATLSYYFGIFPPGQKSMITAFRVMSNLAAAHIYSYNIIHSMRKKMGYDNTKVGFANHVRYFEPLSKSNPKHILFTKLMHRFFHDSVSKAFMLGKFELPLVKPLLTTLNFKYGKKSNNGGYSDFIAINYYGRTTVSALKDGVRPGAQVNDLQWEIYPQGIAHCAKQLYSILPRSIYITENGTCDDNDTFRSKYIYDHVKVIAESGLPVERYYHWSFCDNFEWCEGESARFGIVHVDYETQVRTIKKSGRFYKEMIKSGGVTDETYEAYISDEQYNTLPLS